ncbi:hypothetical protein F5B22DRAFT_652325 [Xylaria bambusicola]|uniref:uncharacterized protein n=1 Tax=Xylaria bambusicola TaxID=326684 RepID=UPI00200762AE|nr:uncharacterized protein F5B22DRAFT_652325 [Xylaria bambusicola]KAI0503181.1 hypothetical protein F5B22DRAFT_652325 [Xylaria bambusicola]
MDSKHILEEELPPPYTINTALSSDSSENYPATALEQHLECLTNRIRQAQEARSIQQLFDDDSLLELIVPEIHDFLAYLGTQDTTPKLAHLTLVPDGAVPNKAVLSGMEEMRKRGEACRVARVNCFSGDSEKQGATADTAAAANSEDWPVGREFSDWGRFGDENSSSSPSSSKNTRSLLWWNDEKMARRLARLLQPSPTTAPPAPPPPPPIVQTHVQAAVEARIPPQKEKRGGWGLWGKKGSSSSSGRNETFATKSVKSDVEMLRGKGEGSGVGVPATKKSIEKGTGKESNGAKMVITAEEVAFRLENEFGLIESIRGWAVVVVVQVKT